MRIVVIAISVVTLVSLSMWAQQPAGQRPGQRQSQAAPPLQGGQVTAADLAAIVGKQPKDRNGNQTFLQLAPYNVNMEHRVPVAQNASVHEKEAELFYVIEGGTTRKLGKGDFVLVPEGVPHWFSAIDGELTMMSLHLPRTGAGK